MKKMFVFSLFTLYFFQGTSYACTTFFLHKNGQMAFGKNYDWMTGTGSVNTNLRGLAKSSLPVENGKGIAWTSKYGSTTFNQYGKEFPNGGMNEKGLVVELMWLNESKFPTKDTRPGLTVLQWIQYQLDNFATVDEVVASDRMVRIISTGTPQHYLVADSKGDVATIEFLEGKMVVHRGSNLPYPVLANSTYESSLQAAKSKKSGGNNSFNRFTNACSMISQYHQATTNKPLVDYSFDILNRVAQPGFTKWNIVYDIANKTIYFKTSGHEQRKKIPMNTMNYACSAPPLWYNMNQDHTGDIGKNFIAFNTEENKKMLKAAFRESGLPIKEELQNAAGDFAAAVRCK